MTNDEIRLRKLGKKFMLASIGKLIDLKIMGLVVEQELKNRTFAELVSMPQDVFAIYIENNPHGK